jgi:hypothetical protein
MDIAVLNQNAEVVMTCSGVGMYRTRPVQVEMKAYGCSQPGSLSGRADRSN